MLKRFIAAASVGTLALGLASAMAADKPVYGVLPIS